MILDSLWMFSGGTGGAGNADGATDSPTTGTQVSSNIVDVGMLGGLPVSAVSGGGGRDLGIGDDPSMKLMVVVTVAFTGGTSLIVAIQTAPDAGNNLPGTFATAATGPTVLLASLVVGARLFDTDLPRVAPGQVPPRFYRLQYTNSGTFTAGKIEAVLVLDRIDQPEIANAVLSGYPAGITIAN